MDQDEKAKAPGAPFLRRAWGIITMPFRLLSLLFEMVAHPERYSFDDDE
jgi:hypothetical protein